MSKGPHKELQEISMKHSNITQTASEMILWELLEETIMGLYLAKSMLT